MSASAALATVGQSYSRLRPARGSSGIPWRRSERVRPSGIPGTSASNSARPAYAKARDATGGVYPAVWRTSRSDRSAHAVGASASNWSAFGNGTLARARRLAEHHRARPGDAVLQERTSREGTVITVPVAIETSSVLNRLVRQSTLFDGIAGDGSSHPTQM